MEKIFSAFGLVQRAALKKIKVKLDLLTDTDLLLMTGKGITGGIYHSFYRYAKVNNKYTKDYEKKPKKKPCLQFWDVNNLHG